MYLKEWFSIISIVSKFPSTWSQITELVANLRFAQLRSPAAPSIRQKKEALELQLSPQLLGHNDHRLSEPMPLFRGMHRRYGTPRSLSDLLACHPFPEHAKKRLLIPQ
ncbi:hypothetical protein, partial [Methanoculleus sp.]|uniref:hypothetical protein n=1 Tax=Methanoculleus sp. TaxID=90427 RepID=UPI00261BDFCF